MNKSNVIDNETKQYIAIILKYYRQKRKLKQFDFIHHNGTFICSADTYSRIENGKLIKRSAIYFNLLRRLDLNYTFDQKDWNVYQADFKLLLKHIYYVKMEEFSSLCEQLKQSLQHEEDFLAKEIVQLMDICKQYYIDHTLVDEDTYDKYASIFPIFPAPLQTIIKHMLFQNIALDMRDFKTCHHLFYMLHLHTTKEPLLQLAQAHAYIFEKRYLESYAIALQLKLRFQKEHNIQRLVEVYDVLLCLYHIVQSDINIAMITNEFISIYKNEQAKMSVETKACAKFLMARITIYQKDLLHAKKILTQLYESGDTIYATFAAIFLFHIFGDLPTMYIKPITNLPNTPITLLYQYFIYKQEVHSLEKQELYLTKYVLPHMQREDPIFYEIVYKELLQLIKQTKHYYIKKRL